MQRIALFLLILLVAASAHAQGYRGKDFWVAFPKNAIIEGNLILSQSLFVTAEARARVQIDCLDSILPFTVETGASMEIEVDTDLEMRAPELTEHKAIHITSDRDISVFVVSHRAAS